MAWSPEQIARRLPLDFPADDSMRISHETIYQALYVQGRGALRRELTACLRTRRTLRMPRARVHGKGKSFVSPEIMISERPAEIADRAVPGHWEGDLILGLGSSAIGTLVERTTRFTILLHLPRMAAYGASARIKNGPALAGHGAAAVRDAITRTITSLPEQIRQSLTWDQGRRWRSTRTCGSPPACRSTSAIRTAPGSAALTRIPTACCANTSPRGPISLHIAPMTSRQ
jgi:IS30 family transposase